MLIVVGVTGEPRGTIGESTLAWVIGTEISLSGPSWHHEIFSSHANIQEVTALSELRNEIKLNFLFCSSLFYTLYVLYMVNILLYCILLYYQMDTSPTVLIHHWGHLPMQGPWQKTSQVLDSGRAKKHCQKLVQNHWEKPSNPSLQWQEKPRIPVWRRPTLGRWSHPHHIPGDMWVTESRLRASQHERQQSIVNLSLGTAHGKQSSWFSDFPSWPTNSETIKAGGTFLRFDPAWQSQWKVPTQRTLDYSHRTCR